MGFLAFAVGCDIAWFHGHASERGPQMQPYVSSQTLPTPLSLYLLSGPDYLLSHRAESLLS